jgi:hypothetical protein
LNVLKSFENMFFSQTFATFAKLKNGRENTKINLFVKEDCLFFIVCHFEISQTTMPIVVCSMNIGALKWFQNV